MDIDHSTSLIDLEHNNNKFKAALERFKDHVELLRVMSGYNLRIFGGYITIQLVLGAWLLENPSVTSLSQIGLFIIDAVLAFMVTKMLYNHYMRRKEVVNSLNRTIKALKFKEKNIYITELELDAPTVFRPWFWWYLISIIIGLIAIFVILFSSTIMEILCYFLVCS